MNEINKRPFIKDINFIVDISLNKEFCDSNPIARAYDFFDKLIKMYYKNY